MFRSSLKLLSNTKCYSRLISLPNNYLSNEKIYNIVRTCQFSTSKTILAKSHDSNQENIYYGLLTPQIRAVKVFSITSSVLGLICQPILYQKSLEIGGTPALIAVASFIGFFTFVTPVLLHWITKKYVTEIDYNPTTKMYTATTISFFLRKKKLEFTPDDVDVPDLLGMFTSFTIKGNPVFIELTHFKDPHHYATIMGYDKPLDFKLGTNYSQETPKSK